MKRDFLKIYVDSQPLSQQAVDALRRYHEAVAAELPAEEVERLRIEAEALFQAVSDYQLRAMGMPSPTLQ
ncbi:hypothetical protein LU640_24475 [Pseudomonas monteilii]|uniref:hypothetical protein n=1 Tax=Pseudomonas monteilii TaxID=76759 RepID=UPI001E5EFE2E|nr:hypothetical protein [Pseudomonas monteilii]MCE1020695.1 hypothetical protein [Pseudomonas monteilii]MCE1038224.1 hypothetical protein [Pseudomonas monteilii]MCE1089789.1 hypothetical protein [Pseudomonas monteilii]